MKKETVRSLMAVTAMEPETVTVQIPRLGLELSFHELSYDRLANIRGTEDIVRQCDKLNGYGYGSVVAVKQSADELQNSAIDAALEDLEKN